MLYRLWFLTIAFAAWLPTSMRGDETTFTVVGYIIPGLIAIWIDRQGLLESICSLLIASVVVRLILILITHGDLAI